ncbi:glycerophosphodiester phosphodiesterase [Deinococcus sp. Arct2-2]|nr:glycerophosphodiester phosphodiesterase [Deinococcus sp. Arct2-2]
MPVRLAVLTTALLSLVACRETVSPSAGPPFDLQAHRGGLALVTENSLASFAHALELGVSTLELDTQVTEDHQVVVTHDRKISDKKCRDTAPITPADPEYPYVGKYIVNLTLAQIKTMDCGSLVLADFPFQRVVPGLTMPELNDVFKLVKAYGNTAVKLNIETKVEAGAPSETAPRELFVTTVLAEIQRSGLANQVTVQSFDWGSLMLVRQLAPKLPIVALTNGQQFLQLGQPGKSPWLGGLDIDDVPGTTLQDKYVAAAKSFGVNTVSPVHGDPQNGRVGQANYVPFTTPALVQAAHAAGMKVVPWTVDDRATFESLMDAGVDGLITDYPDQLRTVLSERGYALPSVSHLSAEQWCQLVREDPANHRVQCSP